MRSWTRRTVTFSDPTGRTRFDVDPSFCNRPNPGPGAPCPSLTNPQCPEYGRTGSGGGACPSLNNPQCPEYGGSAPCPSASNPRCPESKGANAVNPGPAPNPNDNALKEILSNWTSSTGCVGRGFGGDTCAAVNGVLAGGGTLAAGMGELAERWKAILAVFANPAATPQQLDEAITGLALYLKNPGALKMASKVLGSQVQVGGARFGSAVPGLARYLKIAPWVGGAATAWSNYQGTGGNIAETAVMTGMDMGLIWAGAAAGAQVGAYVGTLVPVPGVGTGVGVVVGAVLGIVYTSIANNTLGWVWDKVFGRFRWNDARGLDMLTMILGGVVWAVGAFHAYRVAPRIWRDPDQARRMTYALTGFPFGTEVRRGMIRGTVLNTANIFLFGTAFLCGGFWQSQGTPDGILPWVILACVALTFVSVVLGLAIIWFNVPTRLVPPHMRDEVGLVTRKLRDRGLRRG